MEVTLFASEGKSNLNIGAGMVRVFIDNDYSYGYFIYECDLLNELSTIQREEYFSGIEKFKISKQTANDIIEKSITPYNKKFVV